MHGGPSVLSPTYSVLVHWPVQPVQVGGWLAVLHLVGLQPSCMYLLGALGSGRSCPFFLKATAGQNL